MKDLTGIFNQQDEIPAIYFGPVWSTNVSDLMLAGFIHELAWVQETSARSEYYWHEAGHPYTYGEGNGRRTYEAQPSHPWIDMIGHQVSWRCYGLKRVDRTPWRNSEYSQGRDYPTLFDMCFLNWYDNKSQALGWHADDSPEMDPSYPIAVVSLGAQRPIYFRRKGSSGSDAISSLQLEHGSLLIMYPGMQLEWEHKIPKADHELGPRVSLTYRRWREVL